MRRTVGGALALLALLALLPAARAFDDPKPPGTPAEQYKALAAEYQKGLDDYMKAAQGAKTNEERVKASQSRPNPEKFAARFLALAEKHPKDGAAVDALVWVISNTGYRIKGGAHDKALKLLKSDYLQSDKIAPLCPVLAASYDKDSQDTLRAIPDKNPHADVKAAACLALGASYQLRASLAKRAKEQPGLAKQIEAVMGKEAADEIAKKGEEGLNKEAVKYFERVVKDFPGAKDSKGKPLDKEAKNQIDGILHPIEVGKAAPEVAGEDTDGKAFKLSDYKGKVVLLDFWGNW
jgi:hypothetical protein